MVKYFEKKKLKSMEHIDVWNLVELLEGSKKGFKWVFKNKCDSLDNLEHYKAKLVF